MLGIASIDRNAGSDQNLECSTEYTSDSQWGSAFSSQLPRLSQAAFKTLSPKHLSLSSITQMSPALHCTSQELRQSNSSNAKQILCDPGHLPVFWEPASWLLVYPSLYCNLSKSRPPQLISFVWASGTFSELMQFQLAFLLPVEIWTKQTNWKKKPHHHLTENACKVTAEFQQVSSLQTLSNSQELWKSERNMWY